MMETNEMELTDLDLFIESIRDKEVDDLAATVYQKINELMVALTKVSTIKARKLRRFLSELSLGGFK